MRWGSRCIRSSPDIRLFSWLKSIYISLEYYKFGRPLKIGRHIVARSVTREFEDVNWRGFNYTRDKHVLVAKAGWARDHATFA